jgi:hypothetical protein
MGKPQMRNTTLRLHLSLLMSNYAHGHGEAHTQHADRARRLTGRNSSGTKSHKSAEWRHLMPRFG